MADLTLAARSPFEGLLVGSGTGRGVVVADRAGLGIASVLVRKGQGDALARRVREHFEIDMPREPRRVAVGDLAFARVGPEAWIAIHERGGIPLSKAISGLGDLAAITDQSDGYAVLRLTRPSARDALAKLVPIDLHPLAFTAGGVASTVAAHIGITLWRLDDDVGGAVFEIAVYRSLAASFWHALSHSAAEFTRD